MDMTKKELEWLITRRLLPVCRWLPSERGQARWRQVRIRAMVEWASRNGLPLDEQATMNPRALYEKLKSMGEFDVSAFDDDSSPP